MVDVDKVLKNTVKKGKVKMKSNRRTFIKTLGFTGLGLAGGGILRSNASEPMNQDAPNSAQTNSIGKKKHVQMFNMSGYAAPKIDLIRVGIIGLGQRGPAHMRQLICIEGVEIKALCDLRPEKAEAAKNADAAKKADAAKTEESDETKASETHETEVLEDETPPIESEEEAK